MLSFKKAVPGVKVQFLKVDQDDVLKEEGLNKDPSKYREFDKSKNIIASSKNYQENHEHNNNKDFLWDEA